MVLQEKKSRLCYLFYTICFCAMLSFILAYFFRFHKSLVWDCDGNYQHFNSLVYYGKYLRSILRGLWEDHRLSIPMWDMHIGYGADILTTLSYYGIGDPLALLSVFVQPEQTEYLYAFLAALRMYLSGIVFLMYCRSHENGNTASLLGALAYTFSGFGILVWARHPAFLNPMVYFPLLLLGIDRIFQRRKPWLFIWMTAISAISNFYFFYMSCILMFVYAVVCYLKQFGRIRPRELAGWFFRFAGFFAVGVGIAAITLLPCAMYVLKTGRMGSEHAVPLFYSLEHYSHLLGDFFRVPYVSERSRNYTVLGMVPLALVALAVLFVRRKKYRHLLAGFAVLTVFYLTPFFGHVLNGFSYVSNRWVWGYVMLLAYILVKMYPELFSLTKKEKCEVLALCAAYAAVTFLMPEHGGGQTPVVLVMLFALLAAVAAGGNPRVQKKLSLFFLGMTLAGIALNVWDLYDPDRSGYIEEFHAEGMPYKRLTTKSEMYVMKKLEEPSEFYRYDQYGVTAHENTAMQNGLYGTDFYFSVSNGAVSRFFSDLAVYIVWDHMYDNLDGRSILERLAAVRYFVKKKSSADGYLPYSFDTRAAKYRQYAAYESEETLPFGYTYSSVVSEDTFMSLPAEQRQQAILQGALVEGESALPEAELRFNEVHPGIRIIPDENVEVRDGSLTVKKDGTTVRIEFEGEADSETYLAVKDMDYEGRADAIALTVSMGDVKKRYKYYTKEHNFYMGRGDFLYNMGFSAEAADSVTVQFSDAGTYLFGDLSIVCQPVEALNAQTAALREDVLEQVEFSDNRITGRIQPDQPKLLVFSMAYSDGWTARVDGAPRELLPVNRMYAGLELDAGEHEVELVYETPYLRAGALISFLSVMVCVVLAFGMARKGEGR